jgi:hypothetical protein
MSPIKTSPGLTLAVICAFVMAVTCSACFENSRILDNGKPADAKILKFKNTGSTFNDMPEVTFYLEVYPLNEPPFRAETTAAVPVMHVPALQPGNIVKVKYIPGTNKVAIVGTR